MPEEVERKEPIEDGLSDAEIEKLIELRKLAGANRCEVRKENGKRYLVCWYPKGG